MIIRAKEGLRDESGCKDFHFKEKGKRGTKVSLMTDLNKVPIDRFIAKGSIDDRKMLEKSLDKKSFQGHRIFLDKGYVGKAFRQRCKKDHKVDIVCPPKKTKNGKLSHTLSQQDAQDLKTHRNKIEHVNAIFRNFRSIDVRYAKKVSTFTCYVDMAMILVSILQLNKVVNS